LDIPVDSLIPRVPQRLNYILWIEDLLNSKPNASGIDIGCGSSCIFSLLACTLNKKWKMLTSEIDDSNYEYAVNNVKINKLNDQITSMTKINSFKC
jgi:23S rRNA A1618 N6-methylase RlmF